MIIHFETGNAAFEDRSESARILRDIADKLDDGQSESKIRDVNGNTIGDWDSKLQLKR